LGTRRFKRGKLEERKGPVFKSLAVRECGARTSSCQQRVQKTPNSLSLFLSFNKETKKAVASNGTHPRRMPENPIEDRLLTPLFPHCPTRFITRHAHEALHDGKVSLVSSLPPTRSSAARSCSRGGAAPAITGKADSRCPASTHFAHGTPPNMETNTCCPRGGLLTLSTLNARPTRARCQRHTDITIAIDANAPVSTSPMRFEGYAETCVASSSAETRLLTGGRLDASRRESSRISRPSSYAGTVRAIAAASFTSVHHRRAAAYLACPRSCIPCNSCDSLRARTHTSARATRRSPTMSYRRYRSVARFASFDPRRFNSMPNTLTWTFERLA